MVEISGEDCIEQVIERCCPSDLFYLFIFIGSEGMIHLLEELAKTQNVL